MRQRMFTQNLKSTIILILMSLISVTGYSQTAVSWSLTIDNIADGGADANLTSTFNHSSGNTVNFDGNGASISGWDSQQYWYSSSFSTLGLMDIYFTAQMMSDADGPRDFQLEYRIGNGSWTSQGSVIQVTTLEEGIANINLPSECFNKPDISIRLIRATNTSVSGGTISTGALSYIRYAEVGATVPLAPTTQASAISIVSTTPTTITITANTGNGSNWVLLMNTTNTFTAPADGTNPTGVLSYSGSGAQVMSNLPAGTKTIIVTVPSSTNQYWFRAYAYNYNYGMTMYKSSTATSNPKLCALASINTPTYTNVRLTTATLGGTISSSPSAISDRGIYWSTTPGVTNNSNKASIGGSVSGAFTVNITGLPRSSQLIYFKAYVTNVSGTIMTVESSFTNIPIFTGTGNWEDYTKWNVQQVPGSTGTTSGTVYGSALDCPVIAGGCTISAANTVKNLSINSGGILIISPAVGLTVSGILTNSVGTSGIVIKAASDAANGSLIFANPSNNSSVPASVEMYSYASFANNQYHWQYFGIPVQSTTVGTTFYNSGHRVRKYDETNVDPLALDIGLWKPSGAGNTMGSGEALSPVDGYEVVQPSATTYTFRGNLYTSAISRTLNYTTGADWAGNHILANPYTGAINISAINFGSMEAAVYIYNTGSREEWISNSGNSTPGSNAGTYAVSTGGFAGIFGVTAQIPSMQGFLVKGNNTSAFSIPYSAVIPGTTQQRVRQLNDIVATRIDVLGSTSSDRMWIFNGSEYTRNFDNGFDGRKLITAGTTQLYSIEGDGEYQIDAVNDINNTYLGFQPNANGNYKLVFAHLNIQNTYNKIYLIDLRDNAVIDVTAEGSEYSFSAKTTDASQRFKIVTNTTSTNVINSEIKLFNSGNTIFVQNYSSKEAKFSLYNCSGKIVKQITLTPNTESSITTDLTPGVYIGKILIESEELTKRLIIR